MTTDTTFRVGIAFAVASAVAFGMSGPFAKALMESGWSPLAAASVRMAGGALAMALFATLVHRDWWREAITHGRVVVFYGLIPVTGAQLCFYNAVVHLSVGVALLLAYLAPVLVIGWVWATTRRRPATVTLIGAGLALAGTVVVLDVVTGLHVNTVGVAWAMGAAVGLACFYMLSGRASADGDGLHPLTLTAGGLIVAAVTVAALAAGRVLPVSFGLEDAVIAGHATSFLVPVVVLGVVSAGMAYALGISGVARLRPSYASLVGLSEILFAVLWAWLLVGEAITRTQAIGGAVVLLGLALAGRSSDRPAAESTWPDVAPIDEPADRNGERPIID